jgi:GDP-L-fucose synthase
VDDLADALVFLMQRYSEQEHINVGFGEDRSIMDLALLIADIVGFEGKIATDASKPDGTPQKLLDPGRLRRLGWKAKMPLREGLIETYAWFVKNFARFG